MTIRNIIISSEFFTMIWDTVMDMYVEKMFRK